MWTPAKLNLLRRQARDGGSQPTGCGWRVGPILDKSSALQDRTHCLALYADAFAVNDAHAPETGAMGFEQIFLDDAFDIARWNGVEIDEVKDLDGDRFWKGIEEIEIAFVVTFSEGVC